MVRRLLLSAALVVGLVAVPAAPSAATTVERSFAAAAARYGVPPELLIALGFVQSRLDHRAAGRAGAHGIMQLADNAVVHTLSEAAALTGRSRAELRTSEAANVAGAAAVLRSYADAAGLDAIGRADLDRWYLPVARFAGAVDDQVARLFADTVYDRLAVGVAPRPVTPDRGKLADVPAWGTGDARVLSADYAPAVWAPADPGNYTVSSRESSYPIDYVVIHVTQGSYAGSIAWFQNPASNVSAHYTFRSSDGAVTQSVREKDIGYHAGNWDYNTRSIGIEHEGFVDNPAWFTDAMYRASAALTRNLTAKYGIPRDRSHIIGHREVPGATHTDPGPHWNWTYYLQLVNGVTGTGSGTVDTASTNLNVRSGPGTGYAVVGSVADGAGVTVWCQATGTTVTGTFGTSNVWNRIGTGRWVSDTFVLTGHNGFIPGVPRC
ncbi:Transglycosylase SLT domain-containing protein [Asanoa hainanensis]|uniref:N-acetylmuramoyl-L-alanine amidase n=1 Tax=Asanoa hainanensis TaxID=560556 RepID=A0A239GH81_9ACTN|nr:N-acetylmuramoyl-L-alanine amidase [Asanoa hainanensis]SNS68490.1 Transglycosylase SLT domain-containing protein [Asanoa hainanensis]